MAAPSQKHPVSFLRDTLERIALDLNRNRSFHLDAIIKAEDVRMKQGVSVKVLHRFGIPQLVADAIDIRKVDKTTVRAIICMSVFSSGTTYDSDLLFSTGVHVKAIAAARKWEDKLLCSVLELLINMSAVCADGINQLLDCGLVAVLIDILQSTSSSSIVNCCLWIIANMCHAHERARSAFHDADIHNVLYLLRGFPSPKLPDVVRNLLYNQKYDVALRFFPLIGAFLDHKLETHKSVAETLVGNIAEAWSLSVEVVTWRAKDAHAELGIPAREPVLDNLIELKAKEIVRPVVPDKESK